MDTNVLVSAFAARGLSADLLELVSLEHELLTGQETLKEFARALAVKLKVPAERRTEAIETILRDASLVVEDSVRADCDADDDDRRILGEAIAAGAEAFVTGDKELVGAGSVGSMKILTPRRLWEVLKKGSGA